MTLSTRSIATAIAGLSVTGVSIKDITDIPKSINKGNCPIFFPHPDEWYQGTKSEPGQGGLYAGHAGVYDAVRTMRYIYLHSPAVTANIISDTYPDMSDKVDLLYSALAGLNGEAGTLTVQSINVSEFGEIAAPAAGTSQIRNRFYGCFFTIQILEQSSS